MKTLYLMRHGETLFNQLRRIQGWCDSPLTAKGIGQALAARQWFAAQGITLDEAYCSTAERATDTLELVTKLPYLRKKGLREHGFGQFEGQPEYLNPTPPYGDFFVPWGGESDAQLEARITQTIGTIMEQATGANILVVSHAGACHTFLQHYAPNQLHQRLPNAGIIIFDYAQGDFKLRQIVDPQNAEA